MSDQDLTTYPPVKPIPGFPGCIAGRDGIIWIARSIGWVRARFRKKQGYIYIYMPRSICAKERIFAHRLVLLAFHGPCPPGMECCHGNGIRDDNRIENLRWDTPLANSHDRYLHGTMGFGEDSPNAKLTDELVREARIAWKCGERIPDIAARMSVDRRTISRAVKREMWRHVV